ncbi:SPOSA6832_01763 [Sporobolomyces salmonicolor]|uniref:SPOSA6832_01763-mRNA-1:cds n=1 Tax=Sporidiobolus salmonicolor TaxID=5005 RepID=A0A0D6EKF8_SPOSA|nr:SPOSA6832_01763 [Sporobolomyces salmonicolor]
MLARPPTASILLRSPFSCVPARRLSLSSAPPSAFFSCRLSTAATRPPPTAQRALLYVPGSNPKQLKKCLGGGLAQSQPDALILDLEDSVRAEKKGEARRNVLERIAWVDEMRERAADQFRGGDDDSALQATPDCPSQKFVRINSKQLGLDDLEVLLTTPHLEGLVLPKVHSAADVQLVDRFIEEHGLRETKDKLRIVASIESPLALLNLREVRGAFRSPSWRNVTRLNWVAWDTDRYQLYAHLLPSRAPRPSSPARVTQSPHPRPQFAAEDFCASSGLIRTPSRREMLFARSSVVTAAKAFGLKAVDLVCVQYKGDEALGVLEDEAREGRELGFDGKQAIHPAQVNVIQAAFTPSPAAIERALAILSQYEAARSSGAGAYGLENADGSSSMIDAPMDLAVLQEGARISDRVNLKQLLQAEGTLAQARAAGVDV